MTSITLIIWKINKLLDIPLLENRIKVRENFTDRDSRIGEGDILGFY